MRHQVIFLLKIITAMSFPYLIYEYKSEVRYNGDNIQTTSQLFLSLSYPTFVVHDLVEHVLRHGLRQLLGFLLLILRVLGAHPVTRQNVTVTFNKNEAVREANIISNAKNEMTDLKARKTELI